MNFPSLRLEGSILSADLLDAIAREDKHSQKPADFGLAGSAKVKDEIATTWAAAKTLWATYQSKIDGLKEGQTGASETRNLFVLPLLTLLGYQPEKADAEVMREKTYAISHRDPSRDGLPLHIMGWNDRLEIKRSAGGPRLSPHALVQEYLNLTEHLYALVTNGRQIRLLRDSSRLIKLSFLEFDFVRMFEEDLYADFAMLYRLLHASRMPANRQSAAGCILEKYHQDSVDSGSRIRDGLAVAVRFAMENVANGLLADVHNQALIDRLREDPSKAGELHQDLLRWIYRTLFLFVIEERGLNHSPDASLKQRRIYLDYYSLQRLRRLADRPQQADRRSHDLWSAMHQTLRLYEDGGKGLPLGVAPLGSFLFREEGLQALFQYRLDNRSLLDSLNRLSNFVHPDTKVRMRVNYGALDVEEFGSVYESLLELRPRIISSAEKLKFTYAQLAGNERKTTGSYYTPDSLVQCLLDSALDPVVEDRLDGVKGVEDREAALLSIKVCDPAVGSGHFLIGAAHRLAQRLAEIRAGEEALSPEVQRRALRDVVSHCLYGVDINPLSAELCKVSLWMLGMEPGKPLGFLDHHIKCGNSLLGATPEAVARGIPDDAFKPIAGDDKKYCANFKKENKKEAKNVKGESQGSLFDRELKPWEALGDLPRAIANLDSMADDTPDAVRAKAEAYARAVASTGYLSSRFLHDAWCAAFVWRKCKTEDGGFDYPITNEIIHCIQRNPHDCPVWMRDEVMRLAEQYRFFHWHVEFPDVFHPWDTENGGFDVILGNPPWDMVELSEKEYFAERAPDIAAANSARRRQAMIEMLRVENPKLYRDFSESKQAIQYIRHFIQNAGILPLSSKGRINLYPLFTEAAANLASGRGRMGVIVPSAIAMDAYNAPLFRSLLDRELLVSLFDFENSGTLFPNVHRSYRFCLLTLGPSNGRLQLCYFAHDPAEVDIHERRIELTASDLITFSPNTLAPPIFKEAGDKEIALRVYSRLGVFVNRRSGSINPWQPVIQRMLSLSDRGDFFRRIDELSESELLNTSDWSRLYSGKVIHAFNHRFATFDDKWRDSSINQLRDESFAVRTEYYARAEEVRKRTKGKFPANWLLGFRDISRATDERTAIAAVVPYAGCDTHCRNIYFAERQPAIVAVLVGNLNSFAFDFFARQKVIGTGIGATILEQLPVLPPATYAVPCVWSSQSATPLSNWLLSRVLELTYTAWDLEPFARDCGWNGPPFRWCEERRFLLRCELDAAFFHLYLPTEVNGEWRMANRADGCPYDETPEQLTELKQHFPTPRDAVAYIMDTFPIVRKKDEAAHGSYRTKETILKIYNAMQQAMATGQPYQTLLDPPPADPRCCHPPKPTGRNLSPTT